MRNQLNLNKLIFQQNRNLMLILRNNQFHLSRHLHSITPAKQHRITQTLQHGASKSDSALFSKIQDKPYPLIQPSLLYSTSYQNCTIRGGPGYTKFGHAKAKLRFSAYGYFWVSFLMSAGLFLAFFDFDRLLFRGDEPIEKYKEVQLRVANSPRAKTAANEDDDEDVDEMKRSNNKKLAKVNNEKEGESGSDGESEDDDSEREDDQKAKKSKTTFRNRKVSLLPSRPNDDNFFLSLQSLASCLR